MKGKNRPKSVLIFLCCAALLLGSVSGAWAEGALLSAPLSAGNTQSGMVRVCLSSLGNPSLLQLTVHGVYSVNGSASRVLSSGASATVRFNSTTGKLTLTAGGTTTDMGGGFQLRRHQSSVESGIKIAQGRVSKNLYPADFTFTVRSGSSGYKLYTVASVFIEDYLYGVLPYEMGNFSGLEALKAQAVAARTYTMRAMSAGASRLYDVVDTTSDQVYSGTSSGNANCRAAVDATKGIVLKNGDAFTATYYTASNGGQTESIKNAWGSNSYSYLQVKDDPYDLNNPDSRKKSFFVRASGTQDNAKLASLLSQKAAAAFGSGAKVTGVTQVYAHTPKYPEPSRLYTKLTFQVDYTQGGQTGQGALTFDIFSELETPLGMSINGGANELWSVEQAVGGYRVYARRYGHGLGMSQRGAMYMAQLGYTYDQILAFYFEGCTRVQYTFTRTILSAPSGGGSQEETVAETPAPIDPPQTTVTPGGDSALQARVTTAQGSLNLRLSPATNARVLCTIPQYTVIELTAHGETWSKTSYNGHTGYVMTKFLTLLSAPTATETPAPTGAPDQPAAPRYARVTTRQGSLNLRATQGGRVLRTIPQNELVLLEEEGSVWCKVTYGGYTGFVMREFLTLLDVQPAQSPLPSASPTPGQGALRYARVTTVQGSLNLRAAPQKNADVLRTIPQYAEIEITQYGAVWCKTSYGGTAGYVMTSFLTFIAQPSAPAETPAPTGAPPSAAGSPAQVQAPLGVVSLRSLPQADGPVLMGIAHQEYVMLLQYGESWCYVVYNGAYGYLPTASLTLTGGVPNPTAAPVPTAQPGLLSQQARVTTQSGSLNLRAAARKNATVLRTIPQYALVTVEERGNAWCRIVYAGTGGYVMTQFLTFLSSEESASATATPAPAATQPPRQSKQQELDAQRDATLQALPASILGRAMPPEGSALFLRAGCAEGASITAQISRLDYVIITATGNTWCAVEYEGRSGYCLRAQLEF